MEDEAQEGLDSLTWRKHPLLQMQEDSLSNPTRFLVIGADSLELAIGPDGNVVVRLMGLEKEAGLAPGLGVMMALSPAEALQFAQRLESMAQKAKAKRQ